MGFRVSISELRAAGVLIRPAEAAAIVAEVCARITRGELRGVPSIHVLRVSETGELFADGPVTAHRATVARAAQLLEDLLAPSHAAPEFRAPGPLRLVLLRARGAVDLPPFPGFEAFAAAIARFAAPDPPSALRDLYDRWRAASPAAASAADAAIAPAPPAAVLPVRAPQVDERALTISDIRRARRATGMTLHELSDRSRIPPALLRELEWGYLWNWPGGFYGRSQLVRYARAAGLEERLVIDVAWPMLQDVIAARGGDAVRLIPAEESIDVLLPVRQDASEVAILHAVPVDEAPPRRRGVGFAIAAAAAAALVVSPSAFWLRSHSAPQPPPAAVSAASDVTLPVEAPPAHAADHARAREHLKVADTATEATEKSGVRAVPASVVDSPAFSDAGTAMFFHEEGTVLKITRVLDGQARNFHARPSPDGTHIAFDSDRDGMRAVYVADENGHNVHRVSGDGFAAIPSWSPDGSRLAFIKAQPDHPDVWNFWVADLESGGQRQVTFNSSGQPWGGSWFPDGRRIAYALDDAVIVHDLEDGSERTYRSPIAGRLVRAPAVSPDGRHIIFQVSRDGAWLLTLGSGSMRRVLDDPTAEDYSWAPDGHRVAFHSERSGGWGVWILGS
jgi:hypothetical protein